MDEAVDVDRLDVKRSREADGGMLGDGWMDDAVDVDVAGRR